MRILFTSAGRRVELLECFRKSATELQLELVTYAVDLNPEMSSACQKADNAFVVPRCTHPNYIPDILAICERQRINLVIPTIDTELQILSAAADQFKEIGTRIAVKWGADRKNFASRF